MFHISFRPFHSSATIPRNNSLLYVKLIRGSPSTISTLTNFNLIAFFFLFFFKCNFSWMVLFFFLFNINRIRLNILFLLLKIKMGLHTTLMAFSFSFKFLKKVIFLIRCYCRGILITSYKNKWQESKGFCSWERRRENYQKVNSNAMMCSQASAEGKGKELTSTTTGPTSNIECIFNVALFFLLLEECSPARSFALYGGRNFTRSRVFIGGVYYSGSRSLNVTSTFN